MSKNGVESVTFSTPGHEPVTITGDVHGKMKALTKKIREEGVGGMSGIDAPELAHGTIVLPEEHASMAESYFELKSQSKKARDHAKEIEDDASINLEILCANAGPDAKRILFEGSDLALNVEKKLSVKAVRERRTQSEKGK